MPARSCSRAPERAGELGLEPLAAVVASATVAVDPTIMGIAPAYALPDAIAGAGLRPDDIDVYESHEVFPVRRSSRSSAKSAPAMGWTIPDDRLNPNGGAVALGHPFGDSGTRNVLTVATELRENARRATAPLASVSVPARASPSLSSVCDERTYRGDSVRRFGP